MNFTLKICLILGIIIYFYILFSLIKKKSLNLKYSLLWILFGIVMLLVTIFPDMLNLIINILGIVDLTNGVFLLVIAFILLILMSITGIVSKMKKNNKDLVQQCALLEYRIRMLENKQENSQKYD